MKRYLALLIAFLLLLTCLTGCGSSAAAPAAETEAPVPTERPKRTIFSGVDFLNSVFKHINNGGVTEDEVLPYNIDAISGATMTVEGPAVVTSIPLSIRELENRVDGLVRGTYEDSKGIFAYEGIDLYYLLTSMVEGDNGIRLTDTAYRVVLKNSNRAEIASFPISEVAKAHEDGRPILLAYGIGTADGSESAPFVFDAKNETEHSLGYLEDLDNEDGCIKLVYDLDSYGSNDYTTFSNVAYVYVCEETEPGFKHTQADGTGFEASDYVDYILSFRGKALGYEIDLTVKDLENLVQYDANGEVVTGGLGYTDTYSLANNAYWYVNKYEGLDLYKTLLYLGMEDAETMGTKAARTTLVSFLAADGAAANETFSVDTLSYPDAFGFYNKNAADLNDGSYVSTNADLVKTGFPVLLSYGVNNYPYTITKSDEAYVSGLSNSGGPFRVVFGKTQYNHANGSNQVQYVSEIIAGENILYNTHSGTDNAAQHALADSEVHFTVHDEDGGELLERTMRVGEIEDLIFGENVAGNDKKAARVKNHYEIPASDGTYDSAIYEGILPEYLLMRILGLPGTNGTVTFSNGTEELTVPLKELFATGYNTELGRENVPAVLAFARNGAPLVETKDSRGYVGSRSLYPFLDFEADSYEVGNEGGPFCILLPSTSKEQCDARYLNNVTEITVDLVPDSYAHLSGSYAALRNQEVRFYGEGLEEEHVYTVSELESKQTMTVTADYSMLNKSGKASEARYRGIPIYDLFTEIGIKSNAGAVTVYAEDGTTAEFSLSQLKKSYSNWLAPDKESVSAMLVFGAGTVGGDVMQGLPLVAEKDDPGYDSETGNNGGPLKLVLPQSEATEENAGLCVKNVVAVEVSANEVVTWSHSMSDIYEEFLESPFRLTIRNDAEEYSYDFTVGELEAMTDFIVRAKYTVLDLGECEGLNLWKLIQAVGKGVEGIDNPISITAYAKDDYKNDMLSVVYKEGFEKGVENAAGDRLPVLLCYALNGYPVVDDENHPGYTGMAGNTAGPLRCVVEGTQGASVKYCVKVVVTVAGSDPLNITFDPTAYMGG